MNMNDCSKVLVFGGCYPVRMQGHARTIRGYLAGSVRHSFGKHGCTKYNQNTCILREMRPTQASARAHDMNAKVPGKLGLVHIIHLLPKMHAHSDAGSSETEFCGMLGVCMSSGPCNNVHTILPLTDVFAQYLGMTYTAQLAPVAENHASVFNELAIASYSNT